MSDPDAKPVYPPGSDQPGWTSPPLDAEGPPVWKPSVFHKLRLTYAPHRSGPLHRISEVALDGFPLQKVTDVTTHWTKDGLLEAKITLLVDSLEQIEEPPG